MMKCNHLILDMKEDIEIVGGEESVMRITLYCLHTFSEFSHNEAISMEMRPLPSHSVQLSHS